MTPSLRTTDVPATTASTSARVRLWIGRILSGLAALFMIADGSFKFIRPMPQPMVDSFRELGYDPSLAPVLGALSLISALTYAVPRTAVLGAVLLTGYFGGAIATHLRLGQPLFSHVLFPVYIAAIVWGGLYLRDGRVKLLFSRPISR